MSKIVIKIPKEDIIYDIHVKANQLDTLAEIIAANDHSNLFIIDDINVDNLYGKVMRNSFLKAGMKSYTYTIPDGESEKNWYRAKKIMDVAFEKGLDRKSAFIAFGGGVVGDLVGFISSLYMRGIDYYQVPTTLIAQVDSCIGGKTAVNHKKGKNLIGSFYHPRAVFSDTTILRSLPKRELISGLSEVVKYAVISDIELFNFLDDHYQYLLDENQNDLYREIVVRCCEIKAEIVEKDEKDHGLRRFLNFGHTIGHGLESSSRGSVNHGEAVAIGMVLASRISVDLGMLKSKEKDRIEKLLSKLGLPTKANEYNLQEVIRYIEYDKKKIDGSFNFVLPSSIGVMNNKLVKVDKAHLLKILEEN